MEGTRVRLSEVKAGDLLFYRGARSSQSKPMILLPNDQVLGVVRDRVETVERDHAAPLHAERVFRPLQWEFFPGYPNTWLLTALWESRETGSGIAGVSALFRPGAL